MEPIREVWQNVEVSLELAQAFDPQALQAQQPGVALVLAEMLVGPPRWRRDEAELWPFAGLCSLQASQERLRLNFYETRRLAVALDRLFTALDFRIVGHRVSSVPRPVAGDWRAVGGLWLCHTPLNP